MRKVLILSVVAVFVLAVSVQVFAKGHRSGEELFKQICMGCHDTGMMDAPLGGSPEFHERLKAKGMDKLVENAVNGIGDMPKNGSCTDCSEAEIRTAIQYMLDM